MRRLVPILLAFLTVAGVAALPASGQTREYRESQLRLDSIRQERLRLQREMNELQSRVRDTSRELVNIGRQRVVSVSALQELDFQTAVIETSAEVTRSELEATRHRIANRSDALRDRLRSIYMRGPLHTVRVLLSAENFGDLMSRYKYLRLVADYDRRVLDDVREMEAGLIEQERALAENMSQMAALRTEKEREVADLQLLERRSQQALTRVRQEESTTAGMIEEAERDEARLATIISRIEAERRAEEARSGEAAAAPASMTTASLGTLRWPVEGRILYGFGPERKPSGITLTNNGIGIGAAAGTQVRAVEAGRVSHAGPFEGYGSMVMMNHGGGYYTLYMYLASVSVSEGQTIASGAVIGTVGGEQTPEGAHIEFQVRAPVRGTVPEPVDPLSWLRSRAGGS
jgi:septal ring factor EnvC (AmiA/AmiB activator)